jgi:membrane protein implicated in regulation of membrane protease activity
MLSPDFVLSLMQASITGAGLVLAVYALIIPLSRRFFEYRAEEVRKDMQNLKEKVGKTKVSASSQDMAEMRAMVQKISERGTYPNYLALGAGVTFFGYLISAFMSFFWSLELWQYQIETWLPLTFMFTTIAFLLLGLFSIKDISQTMKREFEDLKKGIEEAGSRIEREKY